MKVNVPTTYYKAKLSSTANNYNYSSVILAKFTASAPKGALLHRLRATLSALSQDCTTPNLSTSTPERRWLNLNKKVNVMPQKYVPQSEICFISLNL